MHPDYPNLFRPVRIGGVEVLNRVCHVPTDISSATNGSFGSRRPTSRLDTEPGDTLLVFPRIAGARTGCWWLVVSMEQLPTRCVYNIHGARIAFESILVASGSPTICCLAASHWSVRPTTEAM